MEANYCDPFNTGAWMHQYAALQERQRASREADNVPADQAGFEQQLSDLHLRSSDESSAEGSSPDAGSPVARPAEAHGRIQRTDVGGSMRMPSPFNTRDNWLNNTRYSVDLPRARSSSGDAPPSDLQDGLFSSTRYTAPSELQPVARTKKKKSRGLWSRFKSVVGGKAFAGSRGKKSPSGSASDVDISTEFQVYYAKRGREIEPYEDDEQLISIFRSAAERDRMNPRTVANIASHLRNLSAYLRQNEMAPMADRVNNDSLDADAARYASTNPSIIGALRKLRAACAGQTIDFAKRGREIEPYEDDEQLISIFRSAAEQDRGNPSTVRNTVGHLRNFGAYLRQNEMTPMADRVNEESLDEDAASYACTNPNIVGALRRLRAAYAGQPIDFTRRGRELQPHEEDEQLISIFRSAADRDGMTPGTVTNIASHLRNLSAYLRQNDRAPMIGRINDGSLDADVASYGNRDIAGALRKLRAAYAGQPIDFKRGRGVVVGLHSEDAELLGRFEAAVRRAQVPTETIKRNLGHLKNLANWLFEKDKAPLASRFRGESISNDILEYRDKGGDPWDRFRSALTHLRRLGPGEEIEQLGPGPRVMGPRTLDPYPDDARLIEDATRQALHDLGKSTSRQRMPTNNRASRLRGLSDWLRREQREPIAGRVNGSERQQSELQKDARDYAGATNDWHLRRDLNELRKYEQLVEANQALGLPPP
ncbi:hypothetical protein NLM33_40690 [Bradyrhizobium sp. CCGUVB1N3]|uniref:hypothetical protein n=1 Tax=Bradyrhizobium sp. CCGUVB1N3 TaxID=2949629 RepID=UPI0020B1C328|nr:hypothetical protein [Bradyrhizobium sp. CCGUVB1N3]MCP3476531.1 hypothetical protein [Bradyrhizobium sp. CCGUVB1N3]